MLFKKKKKEVKLVNCYSFFWNEKEPIVKFDYVYELFRKYDLTVVDMRFRSSDHLSENRHMITFSVMGTIDNLRLFLDEVYCNPKLKHYYDSDA